MAKRYWRQQSDPQLEESSETPNDLSQYQKDQMAVYSDILALILEIINSIMTLHLQHNPQLVYALLHRRDLFSRFRLVGRLSDLIENIDIVGPPL